MPSRSLKDGRDRRRGLPAPVSRALAARGEPLDGVTRSLMQSRFAHDFSGVRVYADAEAARSAAALNASAYAVGDSVVFGAGQYAPATSQGRTLLVHELTHVVQARHAAGAQDDSAPTPRASAAAEREAERASWRVLLGMSAGNVSQTSRGIALTPIGDKIKPLISYSAADWAVTAADEASVLSHLRGDPDISKTVEELEADGMLGALINRVDEDSNRLELLHLLGQKLSASALAKVEPYVAKLDRKWQLQFNLARFGVTGGAPAFNKSALSSLVSTDPTQPFTGAGASGVNPSTLGIPYKDQVNLALKDPATTARYTNPVPGSLPGYLATLTPTQRSQQAELLLRQQIISAEAGSYGGNIPSRAQIIKAAAKAHNLHPQMLAAFLLAEQRDQSKNEDAKDYLAATSSVYQSNTSIGLGQVVISTATKNDLFSDLLSPGARGSLSHDDKAKLLASDEFNIFAAAKYIRKVADDGSKLSISSLPRTKSRFPGIDMAAYAGNSSTWPDDNIRAMGSEYTSKPWDDVLVSAWGDFVFEAYEDVIASRVF